MCGNPLAVPIREKVDSVWRLTSLPVKQSLSMAIYISHELRGPALPCLEFGSPAKIELVMDEPQLCVWLISANIAIVSNKIRFYSAVLV